VLQARQGSVLTGRDLDHFRSAEIGQVFASGVRLSTWAEVDLSGVRLHARSQLRVLGVEKTDRGREVLQLESGSAWNVVRKGAGGYQLSTPTVTTAVRGTLFRVDATGLVRVCNGAVSLPSHGDVLVGQGRERAKGTVMKLAQLPQVSELRLAVTSNPGAQISVTIGGRYDLVVRAQRPEKSVELTQALTIDRTPPVLSVSSVEAGGATFTGTGTKAPLLSAALGGQTYTLPAGGPFRWTLPLGASDDLHLRTQNLSATDDVGNRSYALHP